MANINKVEPGSRITAQLMNDLIDAIQALQLQVDALQAGTAGTGQVVITQPQDSTVLKVNQDLDIVGMNFGFSQGAARVAFDDSVVATYSSGSSDSLLKIKVPQLVPPVPVGGRTVVLKVSNASTFALKTVKVQPADVAPGGNVDVLPKNVAPNPSPNPITATQPALFAYVLTPRAPIPQPMLFTVTPTISIASLQAGLQVLRADQSVAANNQIQVNPGDAAVPFFIRLPAAPAASTAFDLLVGASSGALSGSKLDTFTVGQPKQWVTSFIVTVNSFAIAPPGLPTDGAYTPADNTIHIKQGVIGRMVLLSRFSKVAKYDLTVSAVGATNWSFALANTPAQYDIKAADVPVNGTADKNPQIGILANAGASATGAVELRIQSESDPTDVQIVHFNVALAP